MLDSRAWLHDILEQSHMVRHAGDVAAAGEGRGVAVDGDRAALGDEAGPGAGEGAGVGVAAELEHAASNSPAASDSAKTRR